MRSSSSSVDNIGQPVFTVTELNRRARQLLEGKFPLIVVQGEISNLSMPGSGHLYFTLKDEQCQVRCAMFRNRAGLIAFRPRDGDKVQLHARVSLYEGRGDYQLIAETMEEFGKGALIRAFEALKHRLKEEGLFDRKYKQSLPPIPDVIGLVTSPTGAAVRDMLTVLKRRFPLAEIVLYPAIVQGSEAPDSVARAIELAHIHDRADLLIVGRGGGSLEDLWAFNDEKVARAIFASHLPIVSAVGHETDITIADYVADLRAPTPSAAAELISPDLNQWQEWLLGAGQQLERSVRRVLQEQQQNADYLEHRFRRCLQALPQQQLQLEQLKKRLNLSIKQRLQRSELSLQKLSGRLKHPEEQLKYQQYQLQVLTQRLLAVRTSEQHRSSDKLRELGERLLRVSPAKKLPAMASELEKLEHRLCLSAQAQLDQRSWQLAQLAHRLNTVSPLATLSRGYAIVEDAGGNIVRDATALQPGDSIDARLAQGVLHCEVRSVDPDDAGGNIASKK